MKVSLIYKYLAAKACKRHSVFTSETERYEWITSVLRQFYNWRIRKEAVWAPGMISVPSTFQSYSHLTELCLCYISILLKGALSLPYKYHISSHLTQLSWITILYYSCIHIKEFPFVYMHIMYFVICWSALLWRDWLSEICQNKISLSQNSFYWVF